MQRRRFCQTAIASVVGAALPVNRLIAAAHEVVSIAGAPIPAVTGAGVPIELERTAINELGRHIAGRLLTSGDDGYETARQVLNPAIDKHPALIAQCTGAADVRYAVDHCLFDFLLLACIWFGHLCFCLLLLNA